MVKEKVIFLDFDGTLCDPSSFIGFTLRKILDKYDYKFSRKSIKEQGGKKIKDRLFGLGVLQHHVGLIAKKFFNTAIIDMTKEKIKLCCSIKPLKDLKKEGYTFIVVSNNEKSFLEKAIKLHNLDTFIEEVYSSDSFDNKTEKIKEIIKKKKLNKNKTYFVGDRFSDIITANHVGVISVAIHNKYSISSLSEIMSENPHFLICDFKGLKDIVLGNKSK